MLYAGAKREDTILVNADIQRSNRSRLLFFLHIVIAFLAVLSIFALTNSELIEQRKIYISLLLIEGVLALINHHFTQTRPFLLNLTIELFLSSLLIYGIILGVFLNPTEYSTSFVAFILTLPILFLRRPIVAIAQILLFVSLFIFLVVQVESPNVVFGDVLNATVFGAGTIVLSTYIMKTMMQNQILKFKTARIANEDQLTGLLNRNCYETQLKNYPSLCTKTLSCIYIDVNGLHTLNNQKGHEAGDKMLRFIAKEFQMRFGKNHTYRIGGDEYVAFAMDSNNSTIAQKIQKCVQQVKSQNYHVACGYFTAPAENLDISELIKSAESNMYTAKSEYYSKFGIAQRGFRE